MKNLLVILTLFISGIFSQEYCAGDQISIAHQNEEHLVGAGYDGYDTGDIFRLADFNGELNGGQHHVIFIDMSNSW